MSQPFARARAMFALIAAAMGNSVELAKIGSYKSRGKGLGKPGKNYIKNRSKYQPHYGAKESAKFAAKHA